MREKQDKLRQLKDNLIAKRNVKVTYRAVDVGNYEDVDAAVASSVEEMGQIDILINNVRDYTLSRSKLEI